MMSTKQELKQSIKTSSENLCARCVELQEYANRKLHPKDNPERYFELAAFCPSSLDRETCGVCQVVYEAIEKTTMGKLDELWKFKFDSRRWESELFLIHGEFQIVIFSNLGKYLLTHG